MNYLIICFISLLFTHTQSCIAANISNIPKIIWQTYKSKNLPLQAKTAHQTWVDYNYDFKIKLYDDGDIDRYIYRQWNKSTYKFFKALPIGVMKADLWRYLIIASYGGVYSDIDSVCCLPVYQWAQYLNTPSNDLLLLGLENNDHFCQWTIAATPRHPAMQHVCSYMIKKWRIYGINLSNPHFVHDTTGPGVWTEAIRDYLGVPQDLSAGNIYQLYLVNEEFRKIVNRLGILIFDQNFYSGVASINLYGSRNFDDGYPHWVEEVGEILNNSSCLKAN